MLAGASLVGQVAAVGHAARGSGAAGSSGTAAVGRGRDQPQGAQVHFHSQEMLAGLQVLLVVRTGAGEQARVDLIESCCHCAPRR